MMRKSLRPSASPFSETDLRTPKLLFRDPNRSYLRLPHFASRVGEALIFEYLPSIAKLARCSGVQTCFALQHK